LIVHAVDRSPRLDEDRQEIALRALEKGRESAERPAQAQQHVRQPEPGGDEENGQGVVENVARSRRKSGHSA
jgi:hypothetical protein